MMRMMLLCQSCSMILTMPSGCSCGAMARRCMITTSRFRDAVNQNASVGRKMQFRKEARKSGRLVGGMGDDDENASSCNDGNGVGDGVLGESERGADISFDREARAAADAAWNA